MELFGIVIEIFASASAHLFESNKQLSKKSIKIPGQGLHIIQAYLDTDSKVTLQHVQRSSQVKIPSLWNDFIVQTDR